jgi:aryl-alcohol dehydrogenase-like predicted oxidoreductase
MATSEATFAYRDRFGDAFARTYFRRACGAVVSSVGAGTHAGPATDAADRRYREALVTALESGINVLDTAIDYRHQRSERVVGEALRTADVDREAAFVVTKGGFVPFDGARPDDPGAYVHREYVDAGLVDPDLLVRGSHCVAPDFVADQLDRSLANLDLDTVDCYLLNRPEVQFAARDPADVYDTLERTFRHLEARVDAGDLRYYGVATWDGLRVDREDPRYLSLAEVASRARSAAREVGADATRFRAVGVPFNVRMADAFTRESQSGAGGDQSALWFAHDAGLDVFATSPLAGGDLAAGLPEAVASRLAGDTPAQRAINFARSAPGVVSAIAGADDPEHVRENVAAGTFEPLGAEAFDAVFE